MAGSGGPLSGLKVIELAHIMAGPTCGLMLADMGADGIKLEKVPGGDDSRPFLPPAIDGEAGAFLMMNRHRRGLAVTLEDDAGQTLLTLTLNNADAGCRNY